MNIAYFRFYEELNDFLPAGKRKTSFEYGFIGSPAIKDAIEAIGVPHVEIDMILVNGVSVGFKYKLRDKDQVSVYPVFETLNIAEVSHLRSKPLRDTKFIVDVHLGRLARYLRFCGFDTLFLKQVSDHEIIKISTGEHRIILTRDRNLLKNKQVTHGYWVRSPEPVSQLREVINHFSLNHDARPFSRCSICNALLQDITKDMVEDRLHPGTKKDFNSFRICISCCRIYWEGSHYDKMKKLLKEILD